jgi:hypothetical protein
MKTISTRVDDATLQVLEEKAKQVNMTVSEYLRHLIEGTKPTLEQSLAKLGNTLVTLHLCVKPLQELVFELQKFEAELIIKYQNAPLAEKEPEIEKTPIEEEKKPVEQSQTEPETVTASS